MVHGPNLNMLGSREPDVYGTKTLDDINKLIEEKAAKSNIEVEIFQSNEEGLLINKIQEANDNVDFGIINPGALTHYSVAVRDAIASVKTPFIEVHLSNIYAREEFRKESIIAPVCKAQISGLGHDSYLLALEYIKNYGN